MRDLGKNRVIVPLSGKNMTHERARNLIKQLSPYVWGFKLHPTKIMRLWKESLDVVELIKTRQSRIFVDLKGYDIPSEVADMIRDLEAIGVDLITIHASGAEDMLDAALNERVEALLFAITILTSMKGSQVERTYRSSAETCITCLAKSAFDRGLDGTVSSAADLKLFGNDPQLGVGSMFRLTPGIRWADQEIRGDDQARVVTPADAIRLGSHLVVMGRPILGAEDPVASIFRANREIEEALAT